MKNPVKRIFSLFAVSTLLLSSCASSEGKESPVPKAENTVLKRFPLKASQAVAVDAAYFYAISNTSVVKCKKDTGEVIAKWKADTKEKSTEHFKHLNSGVVIDGRLYCAHSRYPVDPNDCTLEIWNVKGEKLEHEKTLKLPPGYGSLTWVDRDRDGYWWMCYAVYGKNKNSETRLVKLEYKEEKFVELQSWTFPKEVISTWGAMSCSGGSWGPDGNLYTTGHDHSASHVIRVNKNNTLSYVGSEKGLGFFGQGVAWDRSSKEPVLWGIRKNRNISCTLIPAAGTAP